MVKRVPALVGCSAWMLLWWQLYPRLGPTLKAWALARLGSTADYFFTYLGPELFVFVCGLVVLPALYFAVLRHLSPWAQALAIPLLLGLMVSGAYWDVLQIAREAERRCTQEAGLKVYRTVEAEGILGVRDIAYWKAFGFKWIEYFREDELYREEFSDGTQSLMRIEHPKSKYQFQTQSLSSSKNRWERSRKTVSEIETGDVIAEIVYFHLLRGWADRILDVGFHFSPPICFEGVPMQRGGPAISVKELILAAIKPVDSSHEWR